MTAMPRICGIGDEGATAFADQVALHVALGLGAIELRTVDGRRLNDIDLETHARYAEKLNEAGLRVPVIDSPLGSWAYNIGRGLHDDLADLRMFAAIAGRYECKQIRIMSYPNDGRDDAAWRDATIARVTALVREAERLGVDLLLENCDGWAGASAARISELLQAADSPALGMLFDTGNGVTYGYESLEILEPLVAEVRHVHLKDSARVDETIAFVPCGSGWSQVRECIALLERSGYDGYYSIEPHLARLPHAGTSDGDTALASSYSAFARDAKRMLEQVIVDGHAA
jgi:sugar phosphate isomerase/epimerase